MSYPGYYTQQGFPHGAPAAPNVQSVQAAPAAPQTPAQAAYDPIQAAESWHHQAQAAQLAEVAARGNAEQALTLTRQQAGAQLQQVHATLQQLAAAWHAGQRSPDLSAAIDAGRAEVLRLQGEVTAIDRQRSALAAQWTANPIPAPIPVQTIDAIMGELRPILQPGVEASIRGYLAHEIAGLSYEAARLHVQQRLASISATAFVPPQPAPGSYESLGWIAHRGLGPLQPGPSPRPFALPPAPVESVSLPVGDIVMMLREQVATAYNPRR